MPTAAVNCTWQQAPRLVASGPVYGLVHQAIPNMILADHGEDIGVRVLQSAELVVDQFDGMAPYPDHLSDRAGCLPRATPAGAQARGGASPPSDHCQCRKACAAPRAQHGLPLGARGTMDATFRIAQADQALYEAKNGCGSHFVPAGLATGAS